MEILKTPLPTVLDNAVMSIAKQLNMSHSDLATSIFHLAKAGNHYEQPPTPQREARKQRNEEVTISQTTDWPDDEEPSESLNQFRQLAQQ